MTISMTLRSMGRIILVLLISKRVFMRLTPVLSMIVGLGCFSAHAELRTYFNQRTDRSYTETLRNITRNGDNLEAVILSEMSKAKTSIVVAVQEIRLPAVAQMLVAKKKAGLDVRLIIEDSYNHNVLSHPPTSGQTEDTDSPDGAYDAQRFKELVALIDVNQDGQITKAEMEARDAIYIIQQGNLPLKDDRNDGSQGSGLMHHKFVVIDGKTTIMSSANFTPSCIHGDILAPATRGNANAMVVADSVPLSRLFAAEFEEMWSGRFKQKKSHRAPRTVTVSGAKITVQFSPTSRMLDWSASTNGLIAKTLLGARHTIDSALFVFSEQKLANAMQQVQAHTDISVVVEPKFAFRPYSELLDLLGVALPDPQTCAVESGNAPWARPIERGGVPSLVRGDVLHHKYAVVDNEQVIFGSHNWSDSANTINDEFAVVIQDDSVASDFSREFARIGSKARWGVPATVKLQIDDIAHNCAHR